MRTEDDDLVAKAQSERWPTSERRPISTHDFELHHQKEWKTHFSTSTLALIKDKPKILIHFVTNAIQEIRTKHACDLILHGYS